MQKLKLTTDQYVPIEVELAGIGSRLLAVLVDLIVILAYLLIMSFVFLVVFTTSFNFFEASSYDFWSFLLVFTIILPFVLYTPLLEYFTKGQTVGKMALGIRVTKINGENAKFKDYFTRWLFRPYEVYILAFSFNGLGIILFIASFFFDTLIASISNKNQRIGDFMGNTVVVRQRPKQIYSVRDIISSRKSKDYQPTYMGISMYTDEDMMLVKRVISRVESYKNKASKALAIELADRIATDLNLEETPPKKLQFLKTVLKDYIVLTR